MRVATSAYRQTAPAFRSPVSEPPRERRPLGWTQSPVCRPQSSASNTFDNGFYRFKLRGIGHGGRGCAGLLVRSRLAVCNNARGHRPEARVRSRSRMCGGADAADGARKALDVGTGGRVRFFRHAPAKAAHQHQHTRTPTHEVSRQHRIASDQGTRKRDTGPSGHRPAAGRQATSAPRFMNA